MSECIKSHVQWPADAVLLIVGTEQWLNTAASPLGRKTIDLQLNPIIHPHNYRRAHMAPGEQRTADMSKREPACIMQQICKYSKRFSGL